MSENTKIEWCDHTFNPWVGCTQISPACDNCYAKAWDQRFFSGPSLHWGAGVARKRTKTWGDPVKWNKSNFYECSVCGWRGCDKDDEFSRPKKGCIHILAPARQRVFCASLADVFDNEVDPKWRADLFRLIDDTQNLDWLLLTKRVGNADDMMFEARQQLLMPDEIDLPVIWPNLWLGATICNQEEADRDIPKLLAVPAHKRFLSMEPLLGPVDVSKYMWPVHPRWPAKYKTPKEALADGAEVTYHRQALISRDWADHLVNWVIVGGESGSNARPMHPDWARSLRDQCEAAGVPFLFKQWGEWISTDQEPQPYGGPLSRWMWADGSAFLAGDGQRAMPLFCKVGKKAAGRLLDGREWNGVPA